jgi:hypothetical protein
MKVVMILLGDLLVLDYLDAEVKIDDIFVVLSMI